MFTLTKINLLWDKVKSLTKKVDDIEKLPPGSNVIVASGDALTSEQVSSIEKSTKANIPTFIMLSSSYGGDIYEVNHVDYTVPGTGAINNIVATKLNKDNVGHSYINPKTSNSWDLTQTTVNPSSYTPPNYSTNEVNTGVKWIDNNTVYRKVFHYTENISGTHNHDISNFGDLVKCNLVCKRADGYIEQAPIVPRVGGWNMSIEDVTTTSFTLFIGSQYTSTYTLTDAWVILEYTKTSANLTKKKATKKEEDNK